MFWSPVLTTSADAGWLESRCDKAVIRHPQVKPRTAECYETSSATVNCSSSTSVLERLTELRGYVTRGGKPVWLAAQG